MVSYYGFNETVFRSHVKKALQSVEQILEANRQPLLAEEIHHKYENKYELANHMTNIAIVAQMNALERLGLSPKIIRNLATTKTTTLRFEAGETCTFLHEQTVDVPSPYSTETVRESSTSIGSSHFTSSSSTIHKVIKKVKEYHWAVKAHWEISIFSGTEVEKKAVLQSRDSSTVVITQSANAPMEKVENHSPLDLNLTWLLQQVNMDTRTTSFAINTSRSKTPRRNEQVDAALQFFCSRMNHWAKGVKHHFGQDLQRIMSNIHNPAVPAPSHPQVLSSQCSAEDLFRPILPLLEEMDEEGAGAEALILDGGQDAATPESVSTLSLPLTTLSDNQIGGQQKVSSLLSGNDTIQLLNAQIKSIDTTVERLQQVFPAANVTELFSITEATLFLSLDHSDSLSIQYQHAIGYLENMLEKQLTAAIGKRVTTTDLEEFVRFHNAKFLSKPPKPFCHAIGRPKRFPYGVLSIEDKSDGENCTPIETLLRQVYMASPLEIALNAATTLQLTGNAYLHGWMRHRSEQEGGRKAFQLSARARQFSSFMLVIGTMAGPNKLNPKDAIILQNKDEVFIPLLLEEIPSAKEFKNAIESLSPEQQRFAQAFRGMQLESSVFGVAVVQIKPQLEALLGLSEDSLAKEIKLTEDLMELFVEHQIPSDLLSFDEVCNSSISASDKVEVVRQNVKAVMDVIEGTKEKQLEATLMKEEAQKAAETAWFAENSAEERFESAGTSALDWLRSKEVEAEECEEEYEEDCALDMFAESSADGLCDEPFAYDDDDDDEGMDGMPEEVSNQENGEADTTPETSDTPSSARAPSKENIDFTQIPKMLDATIAQFDKDSTLRSTKIKAGDIWSRKRQPDLLSKPTTNNLYESDVKSESNKAYDLLDAISRSGSLPIAYSDLHVIVCVTHCFEKDIMATIVEDNINPIDRLEMSTLLLGSTIHGEKPMGLIADESDHSRFAPSFLKLEAAN
ncbi:unnamed protein product [Cylindrotheca closterium]|uniref:Uncharacterized protein n=1 Tax=Cylindrotheca closterium TaxID=2856 RepID=A0AAD2G2P3_9STRA|nr:unnamed protein product [Cylindrotheca closterium]